MIYQINSGQGPAECELGVAKLFAYLQSNYDVFAVDVSPGYYEGTFRSVRIYYESDLSGHVGSVQWICRSPYRLIIRVRTGSLTSAPAPLPRAKSLTRSKWSLILSGVAARAARMLTRLKPVSGQST